MNTNGLKNVILYLARNCYNEKYPCPSLNWSDFQEDVLLEEVNKQKLLPLVYQKFTTEDIPFLRHASKILEANDWRCQHSLIILNELVEAFTANNIEFVVLKGIPLSIQIYGNHLARNTSDIDLLVREADIEKADLVLRNLHFEQFNNYNESQIFEKPLYKYAGCHEYFPYRKCISDKFIEVELARYLHWIKDPEMIERLFQYKELINFNGITIPTLSSSALLAQMIENIYENAESMFNIIFGGTTLSNYVDFMNYIKVRNISAEDIAHAIQEFHIEEIAKVVLEYLKEIFYLDSEIFESVQNHLDYVAGNNIIPRILNHSHGVNYYLNNIIQKIYSPQNPYFKDIRKNKSIYFKLNGSNCNVSLQKHNTAIRLNIEIAKISLSELCDSMFEIKLYKNDLDQKYFCSSILIYGDENNFYLSQNKIIDKYDNTYYIKQGLHKQSKIQINDKIVERHGSIIITDLEIDVFEVCNLQAPLNIIAIDMSLQKKKAENIYYNDEPNTFPNYFIPLICV